MQDVGSGYEMIRTIAEREVEKMHLLEYGRVESVNLHASDGDGVGYTCSVLLVGRTTDEGEMLKLENVPIVTNFMGLVDVPKIDDLVLVSYINGDFELPVIIGRLYSKEKTPPIFEDGQHLWEISKEGYAADVESAKLDIKFVDGETTTINATDSKIVVTIGTLKVTIDAADERAIILDANDNKIEVKDDGNIIVTASTNIELNASADIKIEAGGNVTIKGAKIDLN
jgi:phage baseplate assembly protein gpV